MILPIFAERGRFYGADACHLSHRPAARVSRGLCGLRRRRRRDHLAARLSDGRYPRPSGRRHEQGRQRHGHARRRAEVFPQRQGPAASRRHGGGVRAHRLGCRHGTGGPHLRADARDADARGPALRGCLSERQKGLRAGHSRRGASRLYAAAGAAALCPHRTGVRLLRRAGRPGHRQGHGRQSAQPPAPL